RRPDDLEPGQLIYMCPAADERARKGKTMAHTRLVPVRLTVVAEEDIEAITAGTGALLRREVRVRRLAHEAYAQGGVLSELDLSPNVVSQYLAILDEHQLGRPVHRRLRVSRRG